MECDASGNTNNTWYLVSFEQRSWCWPMKCVTQVKNQEYISRIYKECKRPFLLMSIVATLNWGLTYYWWFEKDCLKCIFQQVVQLNSEWTRKKTRNFGKAERWRIGWAWFNPNDLFERRRERFGIHFLKLIAGSLKTIPLKQLAEREGLGRQVIKWRLMYGLSVAVSQFCRI